MKRCMMVGMQKIEDVDGIRDMEELGIEVDVVHHKEATVYHKKLTIPVSEGGKIHWMSMERFVVTMYVA